jgi:outer membrane biosynthesis protein TonB
MASLIKTCFAASLLILFVSTGLLAQTVDRVEAKPKNIPAVDYPRAAVESGLTGNVSVLVAIDQKGNVVSATDPAGPDWVCPGITRLDVVAMREAAVKAAERATFYPATENGNPVSTSIRLDFQFGSTKPEIVERTIGTATVVGSSESTPASLMEGRKIDTPIYEIPEIQAGTSLPPPNEGNQVSETTKTISGGVLNGKAISLPKPVYPPAARAVHATGAVQIRVLILEGGTVFSAEPLGGHPLLRPASRIAACSASFTPTLVQGQMVKISGIIVYNFVP